MEKNNLSKPEEEVEVVYHGFGDNNGPSSSSSTSPVENLPIRNTQTDNGPARGSSENIKNKTTKRSGVWSHFTESKINGENFAKCNYCTKKYNISKAHGGSGNLKLHLKNNHIQKFEQLENTNQINASVTSFFPKASEVNLKFSREKFRHELTKWIILSNQPHIEVEQDSFINLLSSVNPGLPVSAISVSGDTVKTDIMKEYDEERAKVVTLLSSIQSKLSFTHDIWTSKNQYPFMGIKAHWISSDWKPCATLVGFPRISGSHCGAKIAETFATSLRECGVTFSKIFGITTDNATNNDTFFKEFQQICHANGSPNFEEKENRIRCVAHILNLAVQDLLAHLKLNPKSTSEDTVIEDDNEENEILSNSKSYDESKVVIKLRRLVRKIRVSPQRREKLANACSANNIKALQLIIDVKTRWNSTYAMIARALDLKVPIFSVCSSDTDLKSNLLTTEDWTILENIQEVLKHFDRATEHISMNKHATISSVVPMFDWLCEKLKSFSKNKSTLGEAASKSLEKLKKYAPDHETDKILFSAVVLKPSLKLQYFKEHSCHTRNVKKIKEMVINFYLEIYDVSPQGEEVADDQSVDDDDFLAHLNKRSKKTKSESEIHRYLAEPCVCSKIDTLEWWKINEANFPKLAKMARDVFAVQPTSVPMEREFSGGVDLVVPSRCSMNPDTISASMCLKSWWKN